MKGAGPAPPDFAVATGHPATTTRWSENISIALLVSVPDIFADNVVGAPGASPRGGNIRSSIRHGILVVNIVVDLGIEFRTEPAGHHLMRHVCMEPRTFVDAEKIDATVR